MPIIPRRSGRFSEISKTNCPPRRARKYQVLSPFFFIHFSFWLPLKIDRFLSLSFV